jgi:hypothetical protein
LLHAVIGASGYPGTQGVGFGARRQVGAGEQLALGQKDGSVATLEMKAAGCDNRMN